MVTHRDTASFFVPLENHFSIKLKIDFEENMVRIMLFMEYKFDVKIYPVPSFSFKKELDFTFVIETSAYFDVQSLEELGFTFDEFASDARVKTVTNHELAAEGVGPGTRIENIDGIQVTTHKMAMVYLKKCRYPVLINFSLSKHVVLTDVHPSLAPKGLANGKIVIASFSRISAGS